MPTTVIQVRIDNMQLLKPRESVMLLAMTDSGEFFVQSYIAQGKLFVDFFHDLVEAYEKPRDAAYRMLSDNHLEAEELTHYDTLLPKTGNIDRIHLFVSYGTKQKTRSSLVLADVSLLLKYMEVGVFASEDGKRALLKLLKTIHY